ncbi:MAG: hypothetical protein EP307_05420 [Rhodobacteraceae bacterium]|nr:MAG: hypothetical protein EP307_05420 [Paracoccaceae bacterium]
MTYDWLSEQWSIPVNVSAAKLTRLGKVPVSWSAGIGHWVESPVGGPEGVRFRIQAQLVFPR